MIGLTASTKVWLVTGVTDMRRGFDGLAAIVQTTLAAIRLMARCLYSEASEAIASRCFGGTTMAYVYSANVWSEVGSSGRRYKAAAFI